MIPIREQDYPSSIHSTAQVPPSGSCTVTKVRLPDFLIIGSPKCGTTTLYQYLKRHPSLFLSTPKEMSFFSKDDVFARGLDWYGQLFAEARHDQVCGEASTTYSRWPTYPETVERIAERIPNAKLLYIVRSPVERVYSFYAHRMREQVTMGMREFLECTPEAIHSGRYMSQIEQYLARFPREQLQVLLLEDLTADPAGVLNGVREFLGLREFDFLAGSHVVANRGQGKFAATRSITNTIERVKRMSGAGALVKTIPPRLRRMAFEWLQQGPVGKRLGGRHSEQLTPLTPELHDELLEYFRDDLDRFEEFIGRDLSHWRKPIVRAGEVLR